MRDPFPDASVPLLSELIGEFEQHFGRLPELGARAPGRVNLIGEHTDYNEGLVLPCAIDRDTLVVAAPGEADRVRVFSRDLGQQGEFRAGAPSPRRDWLDYVQAPFAILAREGRRLVGLDLAIASRVPLESGLSSSAALEVGVTTLLDQAFDLGLDAMGRARLAHRGENEFVGVPCGIMDQFASALGRADHALRIDCRDGSVRPIPIPPGRVAILIVQSGVERALAAGGYRERREECEAAFRVAREKGLGPADARALRDFEVEDLAALEGALDPLLFRRARHVVTENQRVEATCTALAQGDLPRAGALLREGMQSLRDDFEVSRPELDALCEIADGEPGVLGSRLTGAGFGGCTVHLVEPARVEAASAALAEGFEKRFSRRPAPIQARIASGARRLSL